MKDEISTFILSDFSGHIYSKLSLVRPEPTGQSLNILLLVKSILFTFI